MIFDLGAFGIPTGAGESAREEAELWDAPDFDGRREDSADREVGLHPP